MPDVPRDPQSILESAVTQNERLAQQIRALRVDLDANPSLNPSVQSEGSRHLADVEASLATLQAALEENLRRRTEITHLVTPSP